MKISDFYWNESRSRSECGMKLKRKHQGLIGAVLQGAVGLIGVSLLGCDGGISEASQQPENSTVDDASISHESGKKLTEVAGRATMQDDSEYAPRKLDIGEQQFIGRYRTQIQCDGYFFPCETGKADFILNFLPDGTVHRSIVRLGKIFSEKQRAGFPDLNYRRDTWTMDKKRTELIVHRKEGINFYYRVVDAQTLQMDLDKSNNLDANNQKLYARGFPKLERAYTLKREPNS